MRTKYELLYKSICIPFFCTFVFASASAVTMRVLECVCARVCVCTHLSTIVLPASVRGTVLLELSPPGAMPPLANPLSPGPNANRTDNVYFYIPPGSCVCFSNTRAGGGEAHTPCRDMTHGKISSRSYRMRRRRRHRIPVTGPETNTRTKKNK